MNSFELGEIVDIKVRGVGWKRAMVTEVVLGRNQISFLEVEYSSEGSTVRRIVSTRSEQLRKRSNNQNQFQMLCFKDHLNDLKVILKESLINIDALLTIQQLIEQLKCPICMEISDQCIVTSCGHLFCDECTRMFLENDIRCPCCRHSVESVTDVSWQIANSLRILKQFDESH